MTSQVSDIAGVRVLALSTGGPLIRTDREAADRVGEALSHRANLIVLPVERLGDDFFRLSTRIAGEIIQKLVNYRLRVAIVGDIARYIADSEALAAFVRESNRGVTVWFAADFAELTARLCKTEQA
ncbi:hypothetical protein BH11PSE2_BH11PSE2_02700 [soil metagenome]